MARTDVVTDLLPILTPSTVRRVGSDPELLGLGLAFSLPALLILLCHELGHWVLCRRHRLDATLPYFLPAPVGLGTFGAFIRIRSLIRDKQQLLDVGVAGPIAGFLALLPVLAAGVWLSTPSPLPPAPGGGLDLLLYRPGTSLLSAGLTRLVHGQLPDGWVLNPHPLLLAGWVGVFATMLNLLPVAQLDGGHILYAALGRLQRRLAWPLWCSLALLGLVWPGWWLWCAFLLVLGVRHPRVVDEAEPLDPRRRRLAWAALAIFVVTFMPEPISVVEIRSPPPTAGEVLEVENQGHGAVVDQLDPHPGAEAAALHVAAASAQLGDQAVDQRSGQLRRRRPDERRPAAAMEIAEQGELRDHQHASSGGREVDVHPSVGVVEEAQRRDLLGRREHFALAVVGPHADQSQQTPADRADPHALDLDGGPRDALQD